VPFLLIFYHLLPLYHVFVEKKGHEGDIYSFIAYYNYTAYIVKKTGNKKEKLQAAAGRNYCSTYIPLVL